MAKAASSRTIYGAQKYAALHMMLSRWLRSSATASQYVYVTLGGTELNDVKCLNFVDPRLTSEVYSCESDKLRFPLAVSSAAALTQGGIRIKVLPQSFFAYRRQSELPHIFFLDLEGIFAWSDFPGKLGKMFLDEVIKEEDLLIVTSHLGHHPGIPKIRSAFSNELAMLGIEEDEDVRAAYRRFHASFTVFKALSKYRLTGDLGIRCLGCIKYRDTSPMGLYGYEIRTGKTELKEFVRGSDIRYFDMKTYVFCGEGEF